MGFYRGLAAGAASFFLGLCLVLFGPAYCLSETLLDQGFLTGELERLDLRALVRESAAPRLAHLPDSEFVLRVVDKTVAQVGPVLRLQLNAAVESTYDYFLSRRQGLNVAISLDPAFDTLRENLGHALTTAPELAGASPAQLNIYAAELHRLVTGGLPPTVEFSRRTLPPETMATLEQVRLGIGYFRYYYLLLVILIAVLALAVVALYHDPKRSSRSLGSAFLVCGAFDYAGVFVGRSLLEAQLPASGLPAPLQPWLLGFLNHLWAPLMVFGAALFALGGALLAVSFAIGLREQRGRRARSQEAIYGRRGAIRGT